VTSPFADASRLQDFLPCLAADKISKKQIIVSFGLPVFKYIAAVDFVQQFVRTSSDKHVMLKHSLTAKSELTFARWRHFE